jgi:hypothetical protein
MHAMPAPPRSTSGPAPRTDPGAPARADLRAQIARLERELTHLAAATYPRVDPGPPVPRCPGGPRVLGLGDLERVRDGLVSRLAALQTGAAAQAERQAAAREDLARMLLDPPGHRGRRIAAADLGLPGCTIYEVRPRLGLLGMLAGWWHVKVSSGCPIGCGP